MVNRKVMSGTTFLEEIISWDELQRAERMEETLPQLVDFIRRNSLHPLRTLCILHMLCQSFVPMVQPDQLEEKVFSKIKQQQLRTQSKDSIGTVSQKEAKAEEQKKGETSGPRSPKTVCHLLDSVINDLHQTVSDGQEVDCQHLLDLLQHVVNMVQGVEHCVRHMATVSNLCAGHVHSLMPCTFHVLRGSYSHCQESSILYGDSLPLVSESLSCVFRSAHSLQMSMLNIVEKLTNSCIDTEQDVQDIAAVCDNLLCLCRLVTCLDLKLTISLWKALSRLAGTQPDVYHEHIDLSGMVCCLCGEISTGVSQLVQTLSPLVNQAEETLSKGDEKRLSKSLRILNFQIKVLVNLVRDFHDYLSESVASIHQILLQLSSQCGFRSEDRREVELCQQLWCASQPALQFLLSNANFIHCVLNREDGNHGRECAQLMLQVMVMDSIAHTSANVVEQWLDTSPTSPDYEPYNLLSSVFASLHDCHVEVCFPVYLASTSHEDQAGRMVSLYQYVIDHMCAFIARCPSRLFHIIEKNLLDTLLGSNPISSHAAQDCWCFLARCSPAAYCWQHTKLVVATIVQVNSQVPDCSLGKPLTSLLRRLIRLLPRHYQEALIQLIPPADHLDIWCEVGVACLMDEIAGEVCKALLPACLNCLHQLAACPSTTNTNSMVPALRCLHNMLQNSTYAGHVTPQQGTLLLDLLSTIWRVILPGNPLPLSGGVDMGENHHLLGALLFFTSDLVDQLDAKLLLHVMEVCCKHLTSFASENFCASVLHFLQAMGPVKIPPCFEQGLVLRKATEVFSKALKSESSWVQYMALEAFTCFAQHTPHEAVVPECLGQDDDLQEKVAAFMNKVPSPTSHKFDTVHFLRQQHQYFASRTVLQLLPNRLSDLSSEPQCKRQKLEIDPNQSQDSYQTVVGELQILTTRLEKLQASRPLPDWVVHSTKPLLQRMTLCLSQK